MNSLTRRDLLTTFLGAPVALAGCSASKLPLPPGEVVGPSVNLGHRLRDGWRVQPAAERWQKVDVVIIGGGIAGLAAAWRLQKAGLRDFILLELEPVAGGTSRFGSAGVVPHPWGAHYIPAPLKENEQLVELFDEMGVLEGRDEAGEPIVAEQYLCRDPQERLFHRGRWFEGLYLKAGADETDQAQFQAFNAEVGRWADWRDAQGRRAFAIPVARSSDAAEVTALDKLTIADWLDQHHGTSPRLRWLVDYACRDDYGTRLEQTSAWAGLFYFVSRLKRSGAEAQPLVTWPEGNGRVVRWFADRVRDQLRLGLAAVEVVPTAAGVDVTAIDPKNEQAFGYRAGQVIFAAPRYVARSLIRPYRESPPKHLAEFEYGSWLVANLFLKGRPAERRGDFPLAWDNVLYDSPALGYVVATHQRGPEFGPTVFTYYYPLCDGSPRAVREKLLATDREGWAEVVLADLGRAHPDLRGLVERLDVIKWGHAMVRPRPGFLWGGARAEAAKPLGGIHFAHSDLSGIGLFEEAFSHGVRAAEEVLAARRPAG